MNFTLSEQMWCLLWSAVFGVGLGALYDIFRIVRIVAHGGKVFTFCCDLIYMISAALLSVFFSIAFSRGSTRYFIVVGEICGFLLFRLTLGRLSVRIFEFFYKKAVKIIKIVTVCIKKTAKKVLQLIERILYNKHSKNQSPTEDSEVTDQLGRGTV